eukprot:TRINITY_DN54453_c0_g1_i1.p1 TRINITY_DN54453_c0_g1~~TRINITY_DN54453_c0_g1_i1.p1  ORF type:complete len:205 (+),score=23.15 TRINITY_DN54453_c0_g1_i1:35-616(+)
MSTRPASSGAGRPASRGAARPASRDSSRPGSGFAASRPASRSSARPVSRGSARPESRGATSSACMEVSAGAKEHVLAIFRSFDLNGDGKIELTELMSVIRALDPTKMKWPDKRIAILLGYMDVDQDLKISFEEFFEFLYSDRFRRERRDFVDILSQIASTVPGARRIQTEHYLPEALGQSLSSGEEPPTQALP